MANYLIIAAASGIGQALTETLTTKGHQVFLTGRSEDKIRPLAEKYQAGYAILDATDFAAVAAVFEQAIALFGKLDGVVNCAGSLLLKSAHLTTQAQYQATIDASLTTAFATVHAAGKTLAKTGGSVVLISSAAALSGFANHEAIACAKAGIIGLTYSAAATYAFNKLRFNTVAPGLTATPLTQSLVNNPTSFKVSEAMHALGRIGTPADIARAILFFLDPANDWITGQVLAVDGGLSQVHPRLKA